MANPRLFKELEESLCDFAVHYLKTSYNPYELVSSCMYFANNDKVMKLLDDWIELNSSNLIWEQRNLQKLLENRPDLAMFELPIEYCAIQGLEEYTGEIKNPVIKQYQASRQHAKER